MYNACCLCELIQKCIGFQNELSTIYFYEGVLGFWGFGVLGFYWIDGF